MDLDALVVISDASIDGKIMGIDEPHLVGTEPGLDLELFLAVLIGDELEIPARAFNLDAHAVGDVHGL